MAQSQFSFEAGEPDGLYQCPGTGKASTEVCTFPDLREFGRAPDRNDRAASHSSYYADLKTLHDVQMTSIQLAGRLYWPLRKIHGSNGWEKRGQFPTREALNRSEGSDKENTGIWQ